MWIILVFLLICAIWFLYKVSEAKAEKTRKRSFDNLGEKSAFSEEKKAMEKKVFEEVYKPFIDKTLTSVPKKSALGEAAASIIIPDHVKNTTTFLKSRFGIPNQLVKDTENYVKEKFPHVTGVVFVGSKLAGWPTKIKVYSVERTVQEEMQEKIDAARSSMGLKTVHA